MTESYVPRTDYIEQLDGYRGNRDLIKVITGVRRAGKSVLLAQFRQHLIDSGVDEADVVYVDLEESRYSVTTDRMLYDLLAGGIRGEGAYVLIDEVQSVPGWEKAVTAVWKRFGADVYVTGSNSQMLSSELSTHITGRYVTVHVLPFSFREFVARYPADGENGYPQRFQQFLRWGGMPMIDLNDSPRKNAAILAGIYDSILNKDVRSRVELDQGTLDNITDFMLANIGNLVSTGSITRGSFIRDPRTTERYLSELCNCFLFYRADGYDIVGREHLRTKAKMYPVDNGLRNSRLREPEMNVSALLESAVYIELVRRGYRVSVGSYRSREVDFTAWDPEGRVEYYQVAYTVSSRPTLKRETEAFGDMGPGPSRTLITMDDEMPEVPEGVRAVNAVEWFLGRCRRLPFISRSLSPADNMEGACFYRHPAAPADAFTELFHGRLYAMPPPPGGGRGGPPPGHHGGPPPHGAPPPRRRRRGLIFVPPPPPPRDGGGSSGGSGSSSGSSSDSSTDSSSDSQSTYDGSGYCPSCGSPVEDGHSYCGVCGKKLR